MPTPEMLKKLLDEFAEKEAHAREEVNLISQQIDELERRVMVSQKRLDTLTVDREKVRTMQARYRAGDYDSINQFESSNSGMPTAASMSLGSQTAVASRPTPAQAATPATSQTNMPAAAPPPPVPPPLGGLAASLASREPSKITAPTPRASMSRLRAMPGAADSPDSLTGSPDNAAQIANAPSAPAPDAAAGGRTAPASSPFVSQSRLRTMSEPPPPPPGPSTASQAMDEIFQGTAAGRTAEAPESPRVEDTGENVAPIPSWPSMPSAPMSAPAPVAAPSPAAALSKSSFFSESDSDFDDLDSIGAPSVPAPAPVVAMPTAPAPAPQAPAPAPSAPAPRAAMPSFGDDDEFEKEMEALAASSAPAQAPAPAAAEAPAPAASVSAELEEDSDDTVKSINDALRGLFR